MHDDGFNEGTNPACRCQSGLPSVVGGLGADQRSHALLPARPCRIPPTTGFGISAVWRAVELHHAGADWWLCYPP